MQVFLPVHSLHLRAALSSLQTLLVSMSHGPFGALIPQNPPPALFPSHFPAAFALSPSPRDPINCLLPNWVPPCWNTRKSVSIMHTIPQGRCCQHLDPHSKRFIWTQRHTKGERIIQADISPPFHSGRWVHQQLLPSTSWVHSGNSAFLKANEPLQVQQSSEAGRLWRELNCHKTGNSDFCSYMLSLCTGAACRGAFYELWQIPILKDAYKQSKYINLPIKHTGSSGPAACLNTSVCQSSSMISACCLQKKPAFWIVFSAESQSWRRQG